MTFLLSAKTRIKKRTKDAVELREQGMLPGILYGRNVEPVVFSVDYSLFEKTYDEAGTSNLIDFSVDGGKPMNVVIKDWQLDPLTHRFLHVDLYQVDMTQEMESDVELTFVGTAPAEKVGGGTLMTMQDTVNVRCLPKDLPDHIEIDLSVLETFDNTITVRDLNLPAGVTCTDGPDLLIASVKAPLSAEQLEKLESSESMDVTKVEVVEKKKEEEVPAEEGTKK